MDVLQDVCEFLQSGGMVAVYDATNTNIERRQLIHHVICERMGYKLFFIESICNDPAIIETNIMVRWTVSLVFTLFEVINKWLDKEENIE